MATWKNPPACPWPSNDAVRLSLQYAYEPPCVEFTDVTVEKGYAESSRSVIREVSHADVEKQVFRTDASIELLHGCS